MPFWASEIHWSKPAKHLGKQSIFFFFMPTQLTIINHNQYTMSWPDWWLRKWWKRKENKILNHMIYVVGGFQWNACLGPLAPPFFLSCQTKKIQTFFKSNQFSNSSIIPFQNHNSIPFFFFNLLRILSNTRSRRKKQNQEKVNPLSSILSHFPQIFSRTKQTVNIHALHVIQILQPNPSKKGKKNKIPSTPFSWHFIKRKKIPIQNPIF